MLSSGGFGLGLAQVVVFRRSFGLRSARTVIGLMFCLGSLDSGWDFVRHSVEFLGFKLKSLILAQIERWRHALHMQVERQHGGNPGGEWRTGE